MIIVSLFLSVGQKPLVRRKGEGFFRTSTSYEIIDDASDRR